MLKSVIERFYKALFNYFVKKDGFSHLTHSSVGIMLFVSLFFAVGTLGLIINFFFDDILVYKNQSKGLVFLGFGLIAALNHVFLFNVLKLEKDGEPDDHLFKLDSKQYRRALSIYFTPIICFFAVAIVLLTIQYLKEGGN